MSKDYEVTIVNPSNPRRRRRRRRAASSAAPKRRRRATPNPGGYRRGAVRNPVIMGFNFDGGLIARSTLRLLGKLGGAFAVKLFAGGVGEPISETTGARWTWWSHLLNLAGGAAVGALARGVLKNAAAGQLVMDGAVDQTMHKLFWSELIHRTEAGPKWLGGLQAGEGDILEDDKGNRWVRQGGRWVAMMGITAASELDGLEYASALGRMRGRRRAMGHLMPATSAEDEVDRGRMIRSGDRDPYSAAYQ